MTSSWDQRENAGKSSVFRLAVYNARQRLAAERLGHEDFADAVLARREDDTQAAPLMPGAGGQLDPVHSRHLHIGQQYGDAGLRIENLQRLVSRVASEHVAPQFAEQIGSRLKNEGSSSTTST
jgi:hypothetical protein